MATLLLIALLGAVLVTLACHAPVRPAPGLLEHLAAGLRELDRLDTARRRRHGDPLVEGRDHAAA